MDQFKIKFHFAELNMSQSSDNSVLDLNILRRKLFQLNIPFRVGPEVTPPDGSCFLHMLMQNISEYQKLGRWSGLNPRDASELRSNVIQYLLDHKDDFVIHGPMTEENFTTLIQDQARENAWTDEEVCGLVKGTNLCPF